MFKLPQHPHDCHLWAIALHLVLREAGGSGRKLHVHEKNMQGPCKVIKTGTGRLRGREPFWFKEQILPKTYSILKCEV